MPTPLEGGVSQLGRWMSPEEFDKAVAQRFPGCMKGTTETCVKVLEIRDHMTKREDRGKEKHSLIF